jgi:Caspase domain
MRPAGNPSSFAFFASWLLVICGFAYGFQALLAPAAAQQPQEKRIALVVGNGAYAKGPLATTANDAGLIAQTLQAAGFDVIGARDLDGDTLRRSFRDFIQKAQASPSDTVAMVYLAGYGVQLAG